MRRNLLMALASIPLLTALHCLAESSPGMRRIGWLSVGSPSSHGALYDAFRDGLRERSYIEGQNIVIEERWAEGRLERLTHLASELVDAHVDVIVTSGTLAVGIVKRATDTIPIVAISTADPVAGGFAASLAHPGGNITGATNMNTDTVSKLVELARELLPHASHAAVLISDDPAHPTLLHEAREAAIALKLAVLPFRAATPPEIQTAFATAMSKNADVLIVFPNVFFNTQSKNIAELGAKYRLPVVGPRSQYAKNGALIAYGPSLSHMYRRAASYVDRILQGAKPGDLPMEQPMKFELILNAKAAKALGIGVPASILLRADKVIE